MKTATRRNLLFLAGCGLVSAGLFPYFHAKYRARIDYYNEDFSSDSAASELEIDMRSSFSSPQMIVVYPTTNTAFDLVAYSVAMTFALLGVGVMFLSSLELPHYAARVGLKSLGVSLLVTTAGAAILVYGFYTDSDVARAWYTSAFQSLNGDYDGPLENQVNLEFCRAFGDRACMEGSISDAKALFTEVKEWPFNADPQASVSSVCGDTSGGASMLDHLNSNEQPLCRICTSITRRSQSQQPDKLALIQSPSQDAIRWCGEYLRTWDAGVDLQKSPFRQHQAEILRNWNDSPVSLALSVRLLTVLIVFSLVAIVGIAH